MSTGAPPSGGDGIRPGVRALVSSDEYDMVVVAGGHMTDKANREDERFPEAFAAAVAAAIARVLDRWAVGARSLCVSGAARGADIIVAEQCLARGAVVRLLVALPEGDFLERSVRSPGTDWEVRYRALRERVEARFQAQELGPPAPGESVFVRNNAWALAEAKAAAGRVPVRALVVWDGEDSGGAGGTADLVRQAEAAGADVAVINPREAAEGSGDVVR
jgi:hypothetical protein